MSPSNAAFEARARASASAILAFENVSVSILCIGTWSSLLPLVWARSPMVTVLGGAPPRALSPAGKALHAPRASPCPSCDQQPPQPAMIPHLNQTKNRAIDTVLMLMYTRCRTNLAHHSRTSAEYVPERRLCHVISRSG